MNFLHPIEIFHYHDVAGYTNKGRFPRLEPGNTLKKRFKNERKINCFVGATYCFRLRFYLENFVIGNFLNIFSLTLQKDNDRKVFYINRECVCIQVFLVFGILNNKICSLLKSAMKLMR